MKTNMIMCRKMNNFSVLQRTKDGMFNATNLLNQWNNAKGNPKIFEAPISFIFIATRRKPLKYRISFILLP